jgi:hypothetical protein
MNKKRPVTPVKKKKEPKQRLYHMTYDLELHATHDLKKKIIIFYPAKMTLAALPINREEMINWFHRKVFHDNKVPFPYHKNKKKK